ncbi:helix-turn-helix transcriptional regulator [Actinophytocola oryzae]|uniref:DNA-binding NarL/FixJ family response regulator n=1 Tax=Actinophytocola oryzae TaxID=502181 RepID=A0A4R7VKC1_9PSEU|nr:LuxR C-terminal-related transcriptional regulator [Actinophytocola oryzae]TDV49920.1 DNA-binding NarL/FixJ family response regulator [Actinophytocola oryzae]
MGVPVPVSVAALDPMVESGATAVLRSRPDITVVPPGESPLVTVVVVDDVGERELDLVRRTRDAAHRPEVVLVAADLTVTAALHALAAGTRGLLRRREASADRLADAVLAAADGATTVLPEMLDDLLTCVSGAQDGASALSERERAVLRLVADGQDTDEIARELCYSPRTVASVVHDVISRFRLRNRAHAVAYALRTGLL